MKLNARMMLTLGLSLATTAAQAQVAKVPSSAVMARTIQGALPPQGATLDASILVNSLRASFMQTDNSSERVAIAAFMQGLSGTDKDYAKLARHVSKAESEQEPTLGANAVEAMKPWFHVVQQTAKTRNDVAEAKEMFLKMADIDPNEVQHVFDNSRRRAPGTKDAVLAGASSEASKVRLAPAAQDAAVAPAAPAASGIDVLVASLKDHFNPTGATNVGDALRGHAATAVTAAAPLVGKVGAGLGDLLRGGKTLMGGAAAQTDKPSAPAPAVQPDSTKGGTFLKVAGVVAAAAPAVIAGAAMFAKARIDMTAGLVTTGVEAVQAIIKEAKK